MRKQHYNITPQEELAMIKQISLMRISLPNMLAITGVGSVQDKKKVKTKHTCELDNNMALSLP